MDLAFLGPESVAAAEAARCAQDQGKFWEYHDTLFANQTGENEGNFNRDNLVGYAQKLGLDETQFTQCLDSHKYRDYLAELAQRARRLGVQGTPSVFVNTRFVPGYVEFADLEKIILEELAK